MLEPRLECNQCIREFRPAALQSVPAGRRQLEQVRTGVTAVRATVKVAEPFERAQVTAEGGLGGSQSRSQVAGSQRAGVELTEHRVLGWTQVSAAQRHVE